MSAHRRRRALTRVVAAPLALGGAVLLVRPEQVARAVRGDGREPSAWVVRLLGGRVLAQQAAVLLHPSRGLVLAGVAADALHAASMVPTALAWMAYRRPAWVSGAVAAGAAIAAALAAPRPED
ncbi:hypothetical protein O2W15_22450 [Modestobacter sp. VKM Ac-2979]|uniref:hypothetical protein n=1 Tax=unclassified Modestobacter TaxID=2643866 RepID=UPI0022AB6B03|nr:MULTISPECIES: hypothetical protein [unclassified Modestobacter]MCZ2814198.1 hypothetical protein [Modestobacter sp. VKM Ac-2979]MCZ2844386.1 hypothetical protein [Modestobacter sp. VKM Ac-2980]